MDEDNNAAPSHIQTLFEPNDISILPQHRFKARQTNLIPAICFYNGSFAPIHAGHVNVLREVKQYIDNLGTHELLATYISPSHSSYLARKLPPEEFIGTGHRLAMIHLAIEDLDWVMVDLYETFQARGTLLGTIMEAFAKRVRSQLPDGAQADLFWLKGEDALFFRPSEKLTRLGYQSVYVFNRGGGNENLADYREKRWQQIQASSSFPERFHRITAAELDLSSTAIRICAHNDSATHQQLQLCTQLDSITTYIRQHHLWCVREDALCPETLTIPKRINQIKDLRPELLSQMLSKSSDVPVRVTSFRGDRIGVGKGWGGPIYRLYNIQYDSTSDDRFPQSMILKLSTGMWNGRVASTEPDFYLNLAPRISHVEIPRCYYAARYADAPNETVLLLEDLAPTCELLCEKRWLDDLTISSLIATLATLHAEFFEHPLLVSKAFGWLPSLHSTLTYYQTKYSQKIADSEYSQLLQSKLSPDGYAYMSTLDTHILHLFETLTRRHYTLAHGDFWVNNVLVRCDQSHRRVLLDWQTCCRANGLIDVVYFLRLLGTQQARALEPRLLQLYHQTLVRYGISQYTLAQIRDDYYTLALPFMLVFFVSWDAPRRGKLSETASMVEDIITHGRATKRTLSDCESNKPAQPLSNHPSSKDEDVE